MCALSPVSFHREVAKSQGPGPDPAVQTGQVDDHPPLKPCKWSHADRDELVDWLGEFGQDDLMHGLLLCQLDRRSEHVDFAS